MRTASKCALIVVAGMLLTGCPNPKGAPDSRPALSRATEAPAGPGDEKTGYRRIELADFSVEVPEGWMSLDPSASASLIEAKIDSFLTGPSGASLKQQVAAIFQNDSIKFISFDVESAKSGFANNLNVVVMPSGGLGLTELLEGNLAQFKTLGISQDDPVVSDLKTNSGTMKVVKYTTNMGGQDLAGHLVLGVRGDKQFNFTFTARRGTAGAPFLKQAEEVSRTIMMK